MSTPDPDAIIAQLRTRLATATERVNSIAARHGLEHMILPIPTLGLAPNPPVNEPLILPRWGPVEQLLRKLSYMIESATGFLGLAQEYYIIMVDTFSKPPPGFPPITTGHRYRVTLVDNWRKFIKAFQLEIKINTELFWDVKYLWIDHLQNMRELREVKDMIKIEERAGRGVSFASRWRYDEVRMEQMKEWVEVLVQYDIDLDRKFITNLLHLHRIKAGKLRRLIAVLVNNLKGLNDVVITAYMMEDVEAETEHCIKRETSG